MNKAALLRLIGRGLVLVFILLALCATWEAFRLGGQTAWMILPSLFLLAGLLLLPGLMILGRHWDQLASVLSGFACLVLFFAGITNVPRALDRLLHQSTNEHPWAPFLALIVLICVWALPWKLHRHLQPRLSRLLENSAAKKAEQTRIQ